MPCIFNPLNLPEALCRSQLMSINMTLKDGNFYKNGALYGKVLSSVESEEFITYEVELISANAYLNGQVVKIIKSI